MPEKETTESRWDVKFSPLLELCGVTFRNVALLRQAFTHASFRNEHRRLHMGDNERLEFLGDAVLELIVSDYLYQKYPDLLEGQLTRMRASIVCEPSLVGFAQRLGFERYIRLGRGEERSGGRNRPALLADVFEAFVGAIYLDGGYEAARGFVYRHVIAHLDGLVAGTDYKTLLQEWVQQHMHGAVLRYSTVEERGPAHAREFVVSLSIRDEVIGEGVGKSKKEAEQKAARMGFEHLVQATDGGH
ncbi:MAG: ribonuclease III [Alicyclobacillaceae bacterium]|jgi:ribonuclease-3|uniref:ribonuclease III n=1 Tax=Alicyclobacillus sp. SP_1 TaxID=2942475 RepID=UPI00215736B7|nr:ribonuclease III [Alicyclobacillus sp. SP_1]MCY0886901.1 ribonuclease III [Alicyclobacillaceae bacterium]MCY0895898.1 ribonuclease III [Alicyclobacillaceae bacterium]